MQDGAELCKATAGLGVPVSVSACIGATCPFIVFESADIDSAVDAVISAAFKKNREVSHRDRNMPEYIKCCFFIYLFILQKKPVSSHFLLSLSTTSYRSTG